MGFFLFLVLLLSVFHPQHHPPASDSRPPSAVFGRWQP